jgi:hypothetical protein
LFLVFTIGEVFRKDRMRYWLGSNTQLYAQGNADAANFIIITISGKRCGRGQCAEAIP